MNSFHAVSFGPNFGIYDCRLDTRTSLLALSFLSTTAGPEVQPVFAYSVLSSAPLGQAYVSSALVLSSLSVAPW